MDRRTVVACLVAALAIAHGGCSSEGDAGGPSNGEGDRDAATGPESDAGDLRDAEVDESSDACPVGAESACDEILWEIRLPESSYPIAVNASVWTFGFVLDDEVNGDTQTLTLDILPDGVRHEYDMDAGQLETVQEFLTEHESVKAHLVMRTTGESIVPVYSDFSYIPFTASEAVIRRVFVSGIMSSSGEGSILVDVRGYIRPD